MIKEERTIFDYSKWEENEKLNLSLIIEVVNKYIPYDFSYDSYDDYDENEITQFVDIIRQLFDTIKEDKVGNQLLNDKSFYDNFMLCVTNRISLEELSKGSSKYYLDFGNTDDRLHLVFSSIVSYFSLDITLGDIAEYLCFIVSFEDSLESLDICKEPLAYANIDFEVIMKNVNFVSELVKKDQRCYISLPKDMQENEQVINALCNKEDNLLRVSNDGVVEIDEDCALWDCETIVIPANATTLKITENLYKSDYTIYVPNSNIKLDYCAEPNDFCLLVLFKSYAGKILSKPMYDSDNCYLIDDDTTETDSNNNKVFSKKYIFDKEKTLYVKELTNEIISSIVNNTNILSEDSANQDNKVILFKTDNKKKIVYIGKFDEIDDDIKESIIENKISICSDDLIIDYEINEDNRKINDNEDDYIGIFGINDENCLLKLDTSFKSFDNVDLTDSGYIFVLFDGTVKQWLALRKNNSFIDKALLVFCIDGTIQNCNISHNKAKCHLTYYDVNRGIYKKKYAENQIYIKDFWGFIQYLQELIIFTKGYCMYVDVAFGESVYCVLDYDNFMDITSVDYIS